MRICVGSTNKVKIKGVLNAFKKYFEDVEVIAVKVSSGVRDQPQNITEILMGSYNRALNTSKLVDNCDYAIGIEAGIFNINKCYMDIQISCIMDINGFYSYGFSPAFPIPRQFAEELLRGEYKELEEIVDKTFDTVNIGEGKGFIGILTNNIVTREDLTMQATIMALIPHIKKNLYNQL